MRASTVISGESDFSNRIAASVLESNLCAVFLMFTGLKVAASRTISVVESSISLLPPPMTPANAIGPPESAITISSGVRPCSLPSRVVIFSSLAA